MKILIVYDSYFGNTEKIARVIAGSFSVMDHITVAKAAELKRSQLQGLDGLVVGSPTRAFTATSAIKKFLKRIPKNGLYNVKVAAFDTRIAESDMPGFLKVLARIFGYAADPIANLLKKKGGRLMVLPTGFIVKDKEGPLQEGELGRAGKWLSVAFG